MDDLQGHKCRDLLVFESAIGIMQPSLLDGSTVYI